MLKLMMGACVALTCLLGSAASAQSFDAPVGTVMNGDAWRKQRDHDLGGRHYNGPNYGGNRNYRPPAPPPPPQFYGHGNNRNRDYGNRGYQNQGRLLYDDYSRGERFRHREESFDQRGRFHQSYRFKNIERDSYENRRRVWEQSHKSNGGGERFFGLGADWNGYSNRSFNHERGRGMNGRYSTGHNLRLGIPGF